MIALGSVYCKTRLKYILQLLFFFLKNISPISYYVKLTLFLSFRVNVKVYDLISKLKTVSGWDEMASFSMPRQWRTLHETKLTTDNFILNLQKQSSALPLVPHGNSGPELEKDSFTTNTEGGKVQHLPVYPLYAHLVIESLNLWIVKCSIRSWGFGKREACHSWVCITMISFLKRREKRHVFWLENIKRKGYFHGVSRLL